MNLLLRLLLTAVCLGVLLFCGFGWMATFEPLDRSVQITWGVIYSIVGILAIVGLVSLHRPAGNKPG